MGERRGREEGGERGKRGREVRDGVWRKTEGCKQYTCFLEMTVGWQHITCTHVQMYTH